MVLRMETVAWLSIASRCDVELAEGTAMLRPITDEGPNIEGISHSILAYAPRMCPDTPSP
jgi:hypothetical protein